MSKKGMYTASRIARIMITLGVVWGVYFETGIFTAMFCLLICAACEVLADWMVSVEKRLNRIIPPK